MRISSLAPALLSLLLFVGGTPAWGQEPTPSPAGEPAAAGLARELIGSPVGKRLAGAELDRVTEQVSSLMRCPVCQGLSVADSPMTSALAMREEARDLLASGYTEDQVLAYFERSYGEFIRLSPKAEGFNLVVWILPVVALAVGAWVIAGRSRRRAVAAPRAAGSNGSAVSGSSAGSRVASSESTSSASEIPEDLAAYAERVRREVRE